MTYRKPHATRDERRSVHPLHLAFLDDRWMLLAYDPARAGYRSFLLARIREARATTSLFEPPADFDPRALLAGNLGRFTGRAEHHIRVRLDAAVAPFVRERPWHPSQAIVDRSDGGLELTLRLNNLVDIERRILACGAHAEVLAPPELREVLRREAEAMLGRYEKSGETERRGHSVSHWEE